MNNKSIDQIAALQLMSSDISEGIRHTELERNKLMEGATALLEEGYARRIHIGEHIINYVLTSKGIEYLEKITGYEKGL